MTKLFFRVAVSILCLPLILAAPSSANASPVVYNNAPLVYDNASPESYTTLAQGINYNGSIVDSFSLTSPVTIDAISFGNWVNWGDAPSSVDWEITTAPNGGAILGSGTATPLLNVYEGSPDCCAYYVYDSFFDIPGVALTSDTTYYLELYDALAVYGGPVYWDQSDNPNSTGYRYYLGSFAETIPSETFELYGIAPEPPSLLLLGTGLAGLALMGMMRRRETIPTPHCNSCLIPKDLDPIPS